MRGALDHRDLKAAAVRTVAVASRHWHRSFSRMNRRGSIRKISLTAAYLTVATPTSNATPVPPFKMFRLSSEHVIAYCAAATEDDAHTVFDRELNAIELSASCTTEVEEGDFKPEDWLKVREAFTGQAMLVGYFPDYYH